MKSDFRKLEAHSGSCEHSYVSEDSTSGFSPFGVSECDVVMLCPACKHLLLCYKAMMVASPAALVLDVHYTFVRPPGFVVVVRHLLGYRFSSG